MDRRGKYLVTYSKIIIGDCMETLKKIPDESLNAVVTSPPYWGLRDYQRKNQIGLEETPEAYASHLVEVFRKIKRVLRDDGTVWLNLGDSYCSSRPMGTSGNENVGGKRYAEAKDAWDFGRTGATSVTGDNSFRGRGKVVAGLKQKDLVGIPWRVAFALQADGWYLRQDIIWHKPNPMPESVQDRCTKAHEYIFLLSKNQKYYYDVEAIKEDGHECRKNKRSVWTVNLKPFKQAHFATYPPDLIEPCILAGCPKGGTVLDPFGGAGTTALVANRNERNAILLELNEDFATIANKRLADEFGMFADVRVEK